MEDIKCVICQAEFRSGCLVDGKCTVCVKSYPDAKTRGDINKKKDPEVANQESLIKELVTKHVNELLESFGILHRCLTCSKLYFKRSPAQKSCDLCKLAAADNSKGGN